MHSWKFLHHVPHGRNMFLHFVTGSFQGFRGNTSWRAFTQWCVKYTVNPSFNFYENYHTESWNLFELGNLLQGTYVLLKLLVELLIMQAFHIHLYCDASSHKGNVTLTTIKYMMSTVMDYLTQATVKSMQVHSHPVFKWTELSIWKEGKIHSKIRILAYTFLFNSCYFVPSFYREILYFTKNFWKHLLDVRCKINIKLIRPRTRTQSFSQSRLNLIQSISEHHGSFTSQYYSAAVPHSTPVETTPSSEQQLVATHGSFFCQVTSGDNSNYGGAKVGGRWMCWQNAGLSHRRLLFISRPLPPEQQPPKHWFFYP